MTLSIDTSASIAILELPLWNPLIFKVKKFFLRNVAKKYDVDRYSGLTNI